MFKRSLNALVFALFISGTPIFACGDTGHHEVAAPSSTSPVSNQKQLINDIWIAAKTTNPWVASGTVAAAVFVMLYSTNDTFRKHVRRICGLSDDCPCNGNVAQNR